MIVFPNCKINLGLHILRKRPDGYHDLETIFYPLPLCDILEIIDNPHPDLSEPLPFSLTGLNIKGDVSSNLCIKAYRLLKRDFPELPSVRIHLHKVIPSGAGLGGGSANGAFTLIVLNKKFKLGLKENELVEYASQLGSDCPLFILNKPCYATGRGEHLEPISLDLSGYKFVVVNPGIHIDTGRAFLDMKPAQPEISLKEIISKPVDKWKYELSNDFEKSVFPKYRAIVDIKDEFYKRGAVYASMTGSGSTVFGIFPRDRQLTFHFPDSYFVKQV